MELASFIGVALLGLALLVIGFVTAIFSGVTMASVDRWYMRERIGSLRLSSLLRLIGKDPQLYAHETHRYVVEGMMDACESCNAKQKCDELLRKQSALKEFTFCENYPAIKALAKDGLERHSTGVSVRFPHSDQEPA